MKTKNILCAIAAASLVVLTSSCNKVSPVIPAAEKLAGTYSGDCSLTVMGSTSEDVCTFVIKKIDDSNISITTPEAGSGAMALPSITVENIPASKTTIDGVELNKAYVAAVSGTITVDGAEKSYNFTELNIVGDGEKVSITYNLQYGKMPMAMAFEFTGTK